MIYSTKSNPNLAAEIINRDSCPAFHRAYAEFLDVLNGTGISVADSAAHNDLIATLLACVTAAEDNAFDNACIYQGMHNADEDVDTVQTFAPGCDEVPAEPEEVDAFAINDTFEGKALVSAFTVNEDTALCRDGLELHFSASVGGDADSGLAVAPVLDERGQPKLLCTLCPYPQQ